MADEEVVAQVDGTEVADVGVMVEVKVLVQEVECSVGMAGTLQEVREAGVR